MGDKIRKLYCYIECNIWTQVLLVLVLITFAVLEIQAISNEIKTVAGYRQPYIENIVSKKTISGPLVVPEDIEDWMTFAYINTVFKLPTDYLANTLGIVDSAYPNVSILRYVRTHHLSSNEFIQRLKSVVGNYTK